MFCLKLCSPPSHTMKTILFSCFFLACTVHATLAQGLFDTDSVLHLRLSGPIRSLLKDRRDNPKKFEGALQYAGDSTAIPVKLSTRGHFRRTEGDCRYPPLLIRFPKDGPHQNGIFQEQHKLKLVMPCDDKTTYLLREWLAYKMYNLITPFSFRARLVRVTLVDDKNPKPAEPVYGILLEEEQQMAARNSMIPVKRKIRPKYTQTEAFLTMAVFQYMIGNTDWSIQYQQNIKLIVPDTAATAPIPVAYDFDHSGLVSAPYARPAEELRLHSVRERRYRGYCLDDQQKFEPILEHFRRARPASRS